MVRSAGVLDYKIEDGKIKVLLAHPGGPFWRGKDIHSWSLPKGELENDENVLDAAVREFKEETNLELTSPLKYLGSHKVSNNKLVIMFYTKCDFDISECFSNIFTLEYPKGKFQECPEMDKYMWADIDEAYNLIFRTQVYFLDKLKSIVGNNN